MSGFEFALLIVIFLVTSAVGIVTGSNSLITVPAMFQLGIEPRVAVATNMAGLVFMAIGGTIPFARAGKLDYKRLAPMLFLTAAGSALGAALVGAVSDDGMKGIVSAAMIAVALFILVRGDGRPESGVVHPKLTLGLVLVLGIYGGLYSGGYVTMLTAVLAAFGGMNFSSAIGSTKLINVVSSAVATAVFMWQGLVDYRLAAVLAVTMFVGGYVGGVYATRLEDSVLKKIFVVTVVLLALKTIYDLTV